MTIADGLMIAAVLLAPMVAIQVSVFLEARRQKRHRQLNVFRVLMATRGARLSPEHVNALNMIEIEFDGRDSRSGSVRTAWKAYLDVLNSPEIPPEVWNEKSLDRFLDLLYHMAMAVGYDFDRTHLRRSGYYPRGMGQTETDQLAIRTGLRELLEGRRVLPVRVPTENEPMREPQALPSAQQYSQHETSPNDASAEADPD